MSDSHQMDVINGRMVDTVKDIERMYANVMDNPHMPEDVKIRLQNMRQNAIEMRNECSDLYWDLLKYEDDPDEPTFLNSDKSRVFGLDKFKEAREHINEAIRCLYLINQVNDRDRGEFILEADIARNNLNNVLNYLTRGKLMEEEYRDHARKEDKKGNE